MSTLLVGLSHKTASIGLLERIVAADADKLLADAAGAAGVREAVVLATCNRVELYAEVDRFHAAVDDLAGVVARAGDLPVAAVAAHLSVRYDEAALAHLFSVSSGLDSMVIGEEQVQGQVRTALRRAQEAQTAGPALQAAFQRALRVGKQVRRETDLGRAGRSVVSVALDRAGQLLGGLGGVPTLVVGAGATAGLVVAVLADQGARVRVANRTPDRARRLARGVGGEAVPLTELRAALGGRRLVVSCTGATDTVVPVDAVAAARSAEAGAGTGGRSGADPAGPLVVLDLAVPRDVDPAVGELAGVTLVDLSQLAAEVGGQPGGTALAAARAIVAREAAAAMRGRQAAAVAPTVVALRSMAAGVVARELARLSGRLPDLEPDAWAEIERTVNRVVEKVLHAPTVRVQQLAGQSVQVSYPEALRELFALDPTTVEAVIRPAPELGREEPW